MVGRDTGPWRKRWHMIFLIWSLIASRLGEHQGDEEVVRVKEVFVSCSVDYMRGDLG